MNQSYMLDTNFLTNLQSHRHREIFARVTLLSWEELPIERIEGKVTGGSINIDGNSSVRRTCSLNLVAKEININNFLWGLNSKFYLEIGLTNKVNPIYPEIIWFKQGMFIATGLNISYATNNYSISLNGKDKMCLLNGEVGGSFPQTIDFGTEEYVEKLDNGEATRTIKKIPVINIMREMLQNYGNELAKNIILKDIEDNGLELIDYKGKPDLYLIKEETTQIYINIILDTNVKVYDAEDGTMYTISTIPNYEPLVGNDLTRIELIPGTKVTFVPGSNELYTVSKVSYGTAMGYRLTELVYPQDLIANVGETVVSILDKIKSFLGDFEYFYDIDGRFIFQKKPIYMDHTWNSQSKQLEVAVIQQEDASIAYHFNDSNLITSFGNQPNLLNARNDYTVWGTKKGVSGAEIYIHARYAIDHKPKVYVSMDMSDTGDKTERRPQTVYYSDSRFANIKEDLPHKEVDWREVIYQMALDYRRFYHSDNFLYEVAKNNKFYLDNEFYDLFPYGKTGYEQYYTDLGPDAGVDIEGKSFWRQLYNIDGTWNMEKLEDIEHLIFWFDFLECENTSVESIGVPTIGDRAKSVNDSNVKSIYYREVPNILFVQESDKISTRWDQSQTASDENTPQSWNYDYKPGYVYVQLPEYLENMFSISTRGKSAMSAIDEMLYSMSYCVESVNISAIPVYSLQPNTRISVSDQNSGIEGEYLVSRLTIPLTYNGTMSITATKAVDTIV